MTDIRLMRMADVLVNYSLKIKKGDKMLISGEMSTQPLIREAYRLAVRNGAFVDVIPSLPELAPIFMKEARGPQLTQVSFVREMAVQKYNKLLGIGGATNVKEMSGADPKKLKTVMQANRPVMIAFMKKVARGALNWCGTLFPTHSQAQEAGMSLEDYENFVYKAALCDKSNPIERWRKVSKEQEKICRRLNKVKEIRIVSKDTDIKARVAGRKWINCDGQLNFPDGEVFTGPVENSVSGRIRFSFPGIYMGREIEDIYLEFEKGRVVKAKAAKGQALLDQLLEVDAGARYVGELAIGTNYGIQNFTKNMLFDEKIGGTVHLALGKSYPESGGKNESGIHWDMLCDMRRGGEIYADGRLIYKNGKLII